MQKRSHSSAELHFVARLATPPAKTGRPSKKLDLRLPELESSRPPSRHFGIELAQKRRADSMFNASSFTQAQNAKMNQSMQALEAPAAIATHNNKKTAKQSKIFITNNDDNDHDEQVDDAELVQALFLQLAAAKRHENLLMQQEESRPVSRSMIIKSRLSKREQRMEELKKRLKEVKNGLEMQRIRDGLEWEQMAAHSSPVTPTHNKRGKFLDMNISAIRSMSVLSKVQDLQEKV